MPCRHCDGSGRVVTCLECACDVAAPERRRWATTAPAAELTSTGRPNELRNATSPLRDDARDRQAARARLAARAGARRGAVRGGAWEAMALVRMTPAEHADRGVGRDQRARVRTKAAGGVMDGRQTTQMAAMTLAGTGPTTVRTRRGPSSRGASTRDTTSPSSLVASGLLGRNVTRPEQAFTIIATGRARAHGDAVAAEHPHHRGQADPERRPDGSASQVAPRRVRYFRLVESTPERATRRSARASRHRRA